MCRILRGGILSPVEDIASEITDLLGKSCVKSVQRGQCEYRGESLGDGQVLANISSVNTDKSILLVDYAKNTNTRDISFYLEANAVKAHILDAMAIAYFCLDWQVIEFY